MPPAATINTTTGVIAFTFEGAPVRAVMLDGELYFVAKDVTERLGYANQADAISKHCKGVAKRYPLKTPGGIQNLRVIFEPDVLRLIIGSNLPAAQRFEKWVFEEVLPSIRKTGHYEAKRDPAKMVSQPAASVSELYADAAHYKTLCANASDPRLTNEYLDAGGASGDRMISTPSQNISEVILKLTEALEWMSEDVMPAVVKLQSGAIRDLMRLTDHGDLVEHPKPAPTFSGAAAAQPEQPTPTKTTRKPHCCRPITVNGVKYDSMSEATRATGIPYAKLKQIGG